MDTIIYSGSLKKEFETGKTFATFWDSKKVKEEDEVDDTIHSLENEMLMLLLLKKRKRSSSSDEGERISKRPHKYDTSKQYFTHPETGIRSIMTFEYTCWFQKYIMNPLPQSDKFLRRFRQRFRLPYSSYLGLVEMCNQSFFFDQWSRHCEMKKFKKGAPLELLVLCVLRYLGRGWVIDDLEEATCINYETIRQFIHTFIDWGSTELYDKFVVAPLTNEELTDCSAEFQLAGLPGCIGSTDATHIIMECCSHRLRQLHMGYKIKHTARTYNLTVNHRRRILGTTTGHPARFNDKTLITFDEFVKGVRDGNYNNEYEFELCDFDENKQEIKVKYRGCYLIVDNGYLDWSVTVPPMKTTNLYSYLRFSNWIESMRKDVECAFGIMKGRWRCLRYGIKLHGIENCDKIWMTCCALHNMLLEIDGLSEQWRSGVKSVYEEDVDDVNNLPFSLKRLAKPDKQRNFDLSKVGYGNDVQRTVRREINVDSNLTFDKSKIHNVNELTLHQFRMKLITHFNICFMHKEVVWPRRIKKPKVI